MTGTRGAPPFLGVSAVSDLVNGWQGGIIEASRSGAFVLTLRLR